MKSILGITVGEPCGVGPEIILRSLAKRKESSYQYRVYGSTRLLEKTAKFLDLPKSQSNVKLIPAGPEPLSGEFEKNDRITRAKATIQALDQAIEDCLQGRISALITAPIDKSIVRELLPSFNGHTEYLAQKSGVNKTVMLLDNTELRVVLATNHISLRDVPQTLSVESLKSRVLIVVRALKEWFGISYPKIALAGVNPHAGELSEESEEELILKPAIYALKKEGVSIEGPFAADSLFPKARNGKWDVLVAMYHDQGLVAAKYPGFHKVVNITLGLPFLRVSPGHGVAYDLVGKNTVDIRSFERALNIAQTGRLENK